MLINAKKLESRLIDGYKILFSEAVVLSNTWDVEDLCSVANNIRKELGGNTVNLCSIMNAKSGKCSEDCKFCAQSSFYNTGVEVFPLVNEEEVIKLARVNEIEGVHRFSLVTSGKVLNDEDFDKLIKIYKKLYKETKMDLCASLGCISYEQALRLKESGVKMYHHNVETSKSYYNKICITHSYDKRIETIMNVQKAGLTVCSGGIIGMGETMAQRIEMAFELRDLGIESIPINILNPINGTPMQHFQVLPAHDILKTIAMFKLINPNATIRFAGGRNAIPDSGKKGFLSGVSGCMVGNLLTTCGNKIKDDIEMIKELGFEV